MNTQSGTGSKEGLREGTIGSLLFAIVAMAVLWIVFVAGVHPPEMLVGALSIAASIAFLALMWRAQEDHVLFRASDVAQVWRVPGQVAVDAILILRVLWQDLFRGPREPSLFELHRFDAGPPCPELLGRELLAVAYMTASPNSIVLGIDERKSMLIVHQLTPTPMPELARKLGAGARL